MNERDSFFMGRISDGKEKIMVVIGGCIFLLKGEGKVRVF